MKGWLALHEGKWHPITDVVDTGKPAHVEGGGNVYHLEGVEKPVHQSKIKDMKPPQVKKTDMKEVTADGKQELVEGKEPLKKDPKARWNNLKKALDSSSAFMDIQEAMADDEPQQEETVTTAPPPAEQQTEEGASNQDAPDQPVGPDEGASSQTHPDEVSQPDQEEQEQDHSQSEEQIKDALREQGYSDPEINYIVHGHHAPELSETDAAKAQATNDMSSIDTNHASRQADLEHEHTKRMNDLEHEKAKSEMADPETEKSHRKRMLDLEYGTTEQKKKQAELELEHKKRMLDLEFERAKHDAQKVDPSEATNQQAAEFELEMKRKEKELELEFKKKELALKLKIQEESARQKAEHASMQAEEDAKTNAVVKQHQAKHKIAAAKVPPPKEPATKKPAGKK